MLPPVVALVNAAGFALLDATQHAQVVPVTVVVDVQLALVAALITAQIHAQAVARVVAMVIAMAVLAAKDAAISVRQIARVCVKIDV